MKKYLDLTTIAVDQMTHQICGRSTMELIREGGLENTKEFCRRIYGGWEFDILHGRLLFYTIYYGRLEMVEAVINSGREDGFEDNYKHFMNAVESSHKDLVKILMPPSTYDFTAAINRTISRGDNDIFELLIETAGNTMNKSDVDSIFQQIISYDRNKMLMKILTHKLCDPNANNEWALDVLVYRRNFDGIEILFMDGRIDITTKGGFILECLVIERQRDLISLLILNKVDIACFNNLIIKCAWGGYKIGDNNEQEKYELLEIVAILLTSEYVINTLEEVKLKKYRREIKKVFLKKFYSTILGLVHVNSSALEMYLVVLELSPLASGMSMHTMWAILAHMKKAYMDRLGASMIN